MEKQFITCVYANCTSDDWQGYQESGEIMVASGKGITKKESLDNAMIEFEKEMKIPETDSSFAVKVEDIIFIETEVLPRHYTANELA
jgi:hypothetical protein